MENQQNPDQENQQQEQQQAQQQSGEPNGQVKDEGMKVAQSSEDDVDEFDNEEEEDFSVAGVNDEKAKQKSSVSGGQGTLGNNQKNIIEQSPGV